MEQCTLTNLECLDTHNVTEYQDIKIPFLFPGSKWYTPEKSPFKIIMMIKQIYLVKFDVKICLKWAHALFGKDC